MSAQRALLEIYGVLDRAGTTGSTPTIRADAKGYVLGDDDNTGWYDELDQLMFPNAQRKDPDLGSALDDMITSLTTDGESLSIGEKSRLFYAIGAIKHLLQKDRNPVWAGVESADALQEKFIKVMALACPARPVAGGNVPLGGPDAVADAEVDIEANIAANIAANVDDIRSSIGQINELFQTELTDMGAWGGGVAQQLVALTPVDRVLEDVQEEHASVVPVGGTPSVVVDTRFSSDHVSLNDLKAVADPRNWALNFPNFFREMRPYGRRPDGWRSVLETVAMSDLEDPAYIRTHLKFFKSEVNIDPDPGNGIKGRYEARLEYDLNDPTPDPLGDQKITVDRGFINMRAKDGKRPDELGVEVVTRKVAHIKNIRPQTQQRFVFIFGYTGGAKEMLVGSARRLKLVQDPAYYTWADQDDRPAGGGDAGDSTAQKSGGYQAPSAAPSAGLSAVSTFFKMAVDTAQEISAMNLDLADRWMSGTLTFTAVAEYTSDVTNRLASEPWRYMDAVNRGERGQS